VEDLLDPLLVDVHIGSARGRKAAPLAIEVLRELNVQDLDLIQNPPKVGVETRPLARLRHTHHMLARLLAEGRKNEECSLITGYSPSRISILQHDPAFKELVAYYSDQTKEVYLNVHERLASVGMAAVEEIQERLEVSPKEFANRELMELAEMALDRSVTPGARNAAQGGGGNGNTINITFVKPQGDTPGDTGTRHASRTEALGTSPIIDLVVEP
jgi:hypothetical protein